MEQSPLQSRQLPEDSRTHGVLCLPAEDSYRKTPGSNPGGGNALYTENPLTRVHMRWRPLL